MSQIDNTLIKLGFNQHEASIYKVLLEKPGLTVYQISKELSISRSSIYPIVNKMYQDGFLVLQNGKKDQYYAADPNAMLLQIEERFSSALKAVQPMLSSITEKSKRDNFVNLLNRDAIIAKTKAMLNQANKEIVMNTDLDLEIFEKEIKAMIDRNVRVIIFSFRKLNKYEGIELYSHGFDIQCCNRIMLVVDTDQVLVASGNYSQDEWIGTHTDNIFMSKIIYEHIHHDIYLLRIKEKLGINLFEMHPDILINSMNERGNIFESSCKQE